VITTPDGTLNAASPSIAKPTERKTQATVYLFLSTNCPISNGSLPMLNLLCERFSPEGIKFVGVVPGAIATADEVDAHHQEYAVQFPVVWDRQHQLCEQLVATHTPQAVVVGVHDEVLYSGRLDDRHVDLGKRRVRTRDDLRHALNDIVAGREVQMPRTQPVGCVIESPQPVVSEEVTYCRDVAPTKRRN